jgi:hypothetical protein
MSADGTLPPGVEHGDEYDDGRLCECGHMDDEHEPVAGVCVIDDCGCEMFDPTEGP